MECTELKKRIDTKVEIDDKMKDRDSNIFLKFLGNYKNMLIFITILTDL